MSVINPTTFARRVPGQGLSLLLYSPAHDGEHIKCSPARAELAIDLIYLPSPGLPHNGTSVGFYPFGSRFASALLYWYGGLALDRFFLIYAGCGSSFGRSRFFVVRGMARG